MIIKETHSRTITKAVLYRIASVIAIMMLTIFFGGTLISAIKVGAGVIVFGTAIYYIHERIWIKFIWGRTNTGSDRVNRSLAKTLIYRAITMIVSFILAKIFISGSSNSTAVEFAIAQAVTNMCLFYITERLFNSITWGLTIQQDE
jgi:uncharacterized membrane protein